MSDSEDLRSPELQRIRSDGFVETPGKNISNDANSKNSSPQSEKKDNSKSPKPITVAPALSKAPLMNFKIKKRTTAPPNTVPATSSDQDESPVPAPQPSGFSRRMVTETKVEARQAQQTVQKPVWMSEEAFNRLQATQNLGSSGSSTLERTDSHRDTDDGEDRHRKLKRPSRRSGVEEQTRLAQDARAREEEREQRYRDMQDDIRRKRQDIDATVRHHYNQRAESSRKEKRFMSPIIKLRNFNNVIKHILINKHARPGDIALDLGCGKGGDLRKWETAGISQYTGIDISNASITEAVRRYRSSRTPFEVTFVTGDAFGTPLPVVLRDFPMVRFPVDIVSMQFCLHYAFETEEKARTTIENVARSLKPGGFFIGTIPNSEFIASKIRHLPSGAKSFGNSIYNVTFEDTPPASGEFENPFGNVYNYYLQDAIDNVPEYIIQFDDLRALADEFGLRLKFRKSFAEFFSAEIPEWYKRLSPRVVDGIKRSDGSLGVGGDESEAAAQFYVAFAFVKAG